MENELPPIGESGTALLEQLFGYDLTFKYSHDQILHNPLVDKKGNPFHHHKNMKGKKVRVFTQIQAKWVEGKGGIPQMDDFPDN